MTYQTFSVVFGFNNLLVSETQSIGQYEDVSTRIAQSIARLAMNPYTSNVLSQLDGLLGTEGIKLYLHADPGDGNYGIPPLSASDFRVLTEENDLGRAFPDIPVDSFMIHMQADGVNNALDGTEYNGQGSEGDFTSSFDRTLFHELFHAYTALIAPNQSVQDNLNTWQSAPGQTDLSFSYAEEIAIAAENFLYNRSNLSVNVNKDSKVRIGHQNASDEVNLGGARSFEFVSFLSVSRQTEVFMDDSTQGSGIRFFGTTTNGESATYNKYFFKPGHSVFSGSSTTYDHYILTKIDGSSSQNWQQNYYLHNDHSELEDYFVSFLKGVMVDDAQSAMDIAAVSLRSTMNVGTTINHVSQVDYDHIYRDNFIGIGADRHTESLGGDNIEINGPVLSGSVLSASTTISPQVLAINNTLSTTGTLIFGASGAIIEGNIPIISSDDFLDASSSVDLIKSGSGNDIIVAGTGRNAGLYNIIDGGAGDDVIIGREADDNLFGGAGRDILHPGSGTDIVHGGAGLDTMTYIDSDEGVNINMHTKLGTGGDAEGDRYDTIENIIGSANDDIFVGAGEGHFFIGGDGADTFYLKDGDFAYGGLGADVFRIDIDPSQAGSRVGIVNPDAYDKIIINGVQFTGFGLYNGGSYYGVSASGGYITKIDLKQGFGGPASPSLLGIDMIGFDAGDAGLTSLYFGPSNTDNQFLYGGFDIIV